MTNILNDQLPASIAEYPLLTKGDTNESFTLESKDKSTFIQKI